MAQTHSYRTINISTEGKGNCPVFNEMIMAQSKSGYGRMFHSKTRAKGGC